MALIVFAALTVLNLAADISQIVAFQAGTLAIVSVLASLGPIVTSVLARKLADERLTGRQLIGGGLALAGTMLVAYVRT